MKKLLIALLLVLLVAGIYFGNQYFATQKKVQAIASYQQCVDAGFPALEMYPPQCRTSDGRSFTNDIGNISEFKDEIVIENPRPNQKLTSPVTIKGKVRGNWLFEASFSGELFDAENKSLGRANLTAQGEWMTIEFVPFSGELVFKNPTSGIGTLKIMNANPSDLPENSKVITIPVEF